MKRPMLVDQRESDAGFWYVVRGGNGANLLTSEMYLTRSNAIRAARAFIASIDPVAVTFRHWTGSMPVAADMVVPNMAADLPAARRRVAEKVRQ